MALAPFKNDAYHAWIEGRTESMARVHGSIPGEFDIWGCSPGCWAVIPRATRWFEVHRWQPGMEWFSPEYCQFLRDFNGPVYTGAAVPEITNHVIYPIDRIEERFSSYFLTSSLALMMALAIDEIETDRAAREHGTGEATWDEDVIGMWGVDMAATEEYAFQRPGCQFMVLEALRRGIGVYLPPESDLMRPMPVYGISEWDHNYIKLTARARELNAKYQQNQTAKADADTTIKLLQGELGALTAFVQTWTNPYGMKHGLVVRQTPGSGLGGGVTVWDAVPGGLPVRHVRAHLAVAANPARVRHRQRPPVARHQRIDARGDVPLAGTGRQ